ncbi:MAG: CoA pyrophosphatase [Natrialbaceae archaeon]|nr:CoA pyrophosphatase [Natrialbaceae archaeon]
MTVLDVDPIRRHDPAEIDDQPFDAAVLAPIIERPEGDALLFTKRADHLGEHPGQMSFPGGGAEPEDDSLLETALREANEEIGLDADEASVVGRIDDIRTITEYSVTPYVARIPDREYIPDEREVAEIAMLPVASLTNPENYECDRRTHPHYGDIVVHYFHVGPYTVWGATGRILVQLLEFTTDFDAPITAEQSRY